VFGETETNIWQDPADVHPRSQEQTPRRIKAASTSMLLIRTVSHENAMRLQSFSLFCLRFFQRRTPQSHTHPSIPCSLARPGETRLSLPREESLGSQDTIEFANGIVAAQHLACMQAAALPRDPFNSSHHHRGKRRLSFSLYWARCFSSYSFICSHGDGQYSVLVRAIHGESVDLVAPDTSCVPASG
jgi:hypothetical protein